MPAEVQSLAQLAFALPAASWWISAPRPRWILKPFPAPRVRQERLLTSGVPLPVAGFPLPQTRSMARDSFLVRFGVVTVTVLRHVAGAII